MQRRKICYFSFIFFTQQKMRNSHIPELYYNSIFMLHRDFTKSNIFTETPGSTPRQEYGVITQVLSKAEQMLQY
jgi:hypothetical protein